MNAIELIAALKGADEETAMELVERLQCGEIDCSALPTGKDNAVQQAQIWAQEARTQKDIVDEIGKLVGCANDWEMVSAVKAALSANGGEAVPVAWMREPPKPMRGRNMFSPVMIKGWTPLYTHPAPPSVAVPEFLLEMSKQMREQPNRMTSHPFWQVRCNRYLPTFEGCAEHHTEVCGDDGVVYRSDRPVSELHEYLVENHEEWCQQWAEENHDDDDWKEAVKCYFDLDCDDLPEELRKVPVQEVEEVVSTHLTQAGAEQFIKRKQHDYPKLFTYVESAYWSPQLRELQDWIISLTAAPSPDHIADAGKVVPENEVGAVIQFKNELLKSVKPIFRPHIEGVCAVVLERLRTAGDKEKE